MPSCKVEDFDWSNNKIDRAGVTPLFVTKTGMRLIGLPISKYVTNINCVGGSYEPHDYDLLDTAIREYNEETFGSTPNIDVSNILGCEVAYSENVCEIVMPINEMFTTFTPNNEIDDFIWITCSQLEAILENRNEVFYQSNTKMYSTGRALRVLGHDIIAIVKSMNLDNDKTEIKRTKRLCTIRDIKINGTADDFINDVNKGYLYEGRIALFIARKFHLYHCSGLNYCIEPDELLTLSKIINAKTSAIYTITSYDMKYIRENYNINNTNCIFKMSTDKNFYWNHLDKMITDALETGNVLNVLKSMTEAEALIYKSSITDNSRSSPKRKEYFSMIKNTNMLLMDNSMDDKTLIKELSKGTDSFKFGLVNAMIKHNIISLNFRGCLSISV